MKKLLIFPILALVMVSCSDSTTENLSAVTYYPTFNVSGDDVIFIPKGETYTDPGVTVTEGDTEIEFETSITGLYRNGSTLDTNVPDVYQVTYSATNVDGFSGTAGRTVIVYEDGDLINSIAGLYTSTVVRNGATGAQYTNMEYVLVWSNPDGTYGISDGIGGYYDLGRSYGPGYAAPAVITANSIPANDFVIPDFEVGTFGGVAVMSNLQAHPESGTLTFSTEWDSGYTFVVTLTKVEF